MYREIMGIKTNYISEGKGKVVLVLHGWGCNCGVYNTIINHLAKRYNVIVPDLPGFGGTDEPPAAFGVAEYADFTAEFIKQQNLQDFIIFAHSLGGRITAKLLTKYPGLPVNKIIITGGAGIKPKRSLKSKFKTILYKTAKALLNLPPVKKKFPSALDNLRKKTGSADYLSASPRMRECLVKIVNEDLRECYKNVKQETLLIWGENDNAAPLSDGKLLERIMPNAGLAVMKNTGHYAFLDNTGLFCSILDAFLTDDNQQDLH
jgi:pimeloyl-ACP methyl ester carboxylesterase